MVQQSDSPGMANVNVRDFIADFYRYWLTEIGKSFIINK